MPQWVRDGVSTDASTDFFIAYKEWVPGSYSQMRAFEKRAGHQFRLTAPGQPDVPVTLSGLRDSAGDGSFQAFGAQIAPAEKAKLVPGVAYTLTPQNTSDTYHWVVAPGVTFQTTAL